MVLGPILSLASIYEDSCAISLANIRALSFRVLPLLQSVEGGDSLEDGPAIYFRWHAPLHQGVQETAEGGSCRVNAAYHLGR